MYARRLKAYHLSPVASTLHPLCLHLHHMTSMSMFIYGTLHTRSHLPLRDNDGKREGQWQLLVFAQVVHVCVIARFDSEVFAKGQATLQRHACLPKTPRLLKQWFPRGLRNYWFGATGRGSLLCPFLFAFFSKSAAELPPNISFYLCVWPESLSWANRGRIQPSSRSGGDELRPLKQKGQPRGPVSSKTQANPNRSYNLFFT